MKKQTEKAVESTATVHRGIPVHGAWGAALLFVVASIAFSSYMVYFGTDDMVSKLLLVPQALFATMFLLVKSVK